MRAGPELYANPASPFVAGFLGDPLLLDGDIVGTNGGRTLHSSGVASPWSLTPLGKAVAVMRPERLRLLAVDEPRTATTTSCTAGSCSPRSTARAPSTKCELDCGPTAAVHVPAGRSVAPHEVGERVVVAWNAEDVPIVTQA